MSQITLTVPSAVNWKTTLFGALTALGAYFLTLPGSTFQLVGQILTVGGPLLLGLFSKDSNVTGGTTVQPSSPAPPLV